MATVGKIVAELTARTAPFERKMKRAQSVTRRFGGSIRSISKRIGKFGIIAATAAATGLALLVRHQLKEIDTLAKLARNLDISAASLQAMHLAAGLAGVESDKFDKALKRMIKSVADAENGLATQVRAFEALGLNIETLRGLKPDRIFELISDAVRRVGQTTESTAAIMDIFGTRVGADLVYLLQQGGKSIEDARRRLDDLGLSLTNIDTANVERANDAWLTFKTILDAVAKKFTAAIAPYLTALINNLIAAGTEGRKMGGWIDGSLELVAKGVAFVADRVQDMSFAWLKMKSVALHSLALVAQGLAQLDNDLLGVAYGLAAMATLADNALDATLATDWGDEVIKTFNRIREEARKVAEQTEKIIPADLPETIEPAIKTLENAAEKVVDTTDSLLRTDEPARTGEGRQVNLKRIALHGVVTPAEKRLEEINKRQEALLAKIEEGVRRFTDQPLRFAFD